MLPENDNFPIFEQESYVFNISENVPGRITVGTVRATDSDVDILSYSLHPPNVRGTFLIFICHESFYLSHFLIGHNSFTFL